MRLLLIGQDRATAAKLKTMLIRENFICDTTDLSEDGLEISKLRGYDVILFDLSVPNTNGYEVLRRLRRASVRAPVLILAGRAELDYRIKGLGFGDDDLLTNLCDHRELVARIKAIACRSKGHCESTIQTGKLVVNLDTRIVSVDDRPIHLTGKEYGILELLSLHKGTTMTKEMFLNHLYGGINEPELKIIDVFVCKLRKKLAQATGGNHYIETVWVAATCFAIRNRVPKFGLVIARWLLRRRARPSEQWHLDDLVVRIARERRSLWCAACGRSRERGPRHELI